MIFDFSFDFYEKFHFIDPHYFPPSVIFVPDNHPKKIKRKRCFAQKFNFAGKLVTEISTWVNIFLEQFFCMHTPLDESNKVVRGLGKVEVQKMGQKVTKLKKRVNFSPPTWQKVYEGEFQSQSSLKDFCLQLPFRAACKKLEKFVERVTRSWVLEEVRIYR